MIIWAKVREKEQLNTDQVVNPPDVFKFHGIPSIGDIVEIELATEKTNYQRAIKLYRISKRIFHNVKEENGECFNPHDWHFRMILSIDEENPIYEKLFLTCKFEFKDIHERNRWGEYGSVKIYHPNNVELGSFSLAFIPSNENDYIKIDSGYFRYNKTIFKKSGEIHIGVGEWVNYEEVFN